MNTVKILHCADIHIGAAESFLNNMAASRRFETLLTFERIIDIARENGVDALIIAGDLFDSNKVEETLVSPVFEKITSVPQIKVIIAAGNHDPLSATSPFKIRKLPENLYVMDVKDSVITFDDLNLRVFGKSFGDVYMKGVSDFSIKPQNDGYINIMVLHGDISSDFNSDYNSITPHFIHSSGMDYIALGHIHKRSEIKKIGNTYFAYSGCPEGQGFDETGEKGVYMGEIGRGICELQFVPTSKRLHIHEKIDITNAFGTNDIVAETLRLIKEKYPYGYSDNLYKIELIGDISDDISLNKAEILSRLSDELYFVKLKDSTEIKIDIDALSKEVTLKGLFVKNMLAEIDLAEEDQKEDLRQALKLGLAAFNSGVEYED